MPGGSFSFSASCIQFLSCIPSGSRRPVIERYHILAQYVNPCFSPLVICTKTKLVNCALCKSDPPRVSGRYLFVILCGIIYIIQGIAGRAAPRRGYIILQICTEIYYILDIYKRIYREGGARIYKLYGEVARAGGLALTFRARFR